MRVIYPAFGLAVLFSTPFIAPLTSPNHGALYHLHGEPSQLFVPAFLLLAGSWLLITAALWALQRLGSLYPRLSPLYSIFWWTILCTLPWFGLRDIAVLRDTSLPARLGHGLLAAGVLVWIIGIIWGWQQRSTRFRPVAAMMETIFSFVAISGAFLVLQLCWLLHQAQNLNPPFLSKAPPAPLNAPHPSGRVIWLVLDELSYKQVYETRFPGLDLPSFYRLAQTSVVFTHVVPAGLLTENVLPTLITGLPVTSISASANGQRLLLRTTGDTAGEKGQRFDQHSTVFADALAAGYRTGLTGWFNPYCRLMPAVLDQCVWVPLHDQLPGGLRTDASIKDAVFEPLRSFARSSLRLLSPRDRDLNADRWSLDARIKEFQQLKTAADRMLEEGDLTFLLLHLPVPHPQGFYDRRTGQFVDDGQSSYIDNLALADLYLGHVEQVLRQRGEWDRATIVVMGDHSWRTRQMWRSSRGWTPEDAAASDGGSFDPRPAYLVKLPGETQGARIDQEFDATRTRLLLDALLRDQIHTPEDLRLWVGNAAAPIAR